MKRVPVFPRGKKVCIVNVRAGVLLLGVVWPVLAAAQTQPKSLVTRAIDETKLVFLHGSVSPLTRTAQDQGAVPDAFPAERMILMLNRPPERETALQQFLRDAHTPATATFHHWLTPQQFGAQFGPGDGDVEIASQWLAGHGFRLTKLAKSRQFLEFSGTAGQVRSAFHTEIHQYSTAQDAAGAAGPHYANATELQIPAALTGLVRGVAPMNNFRAEPQVKVEGRALYARAGKKTTPLWTTPNPYGTPNPYAFSVTPEDFATQYDLGPLYQAGVNGAGQTIGIVNESNIDLSLVQAYQSLFGVQGSMPQVVIDGDDPGPISGVDTEAYLDVELSGAVAPKATVNLYIANAGYLIDPLELAAVRAVDDNQASVLSVSFGQCEQILGTAGNQFWSQLWEQAAAQGQTVLVSSGDIGSECQFEAINTVSGLASTEWNVAVGGTDFYYSDYATGGASATTLWNTNNDANLGSLKAPLPEQPWNDAYGFDIIADGYQRGERYAGGGGASNCATVDETNGSCKSGYTKPSWQNGPGVPADGARDIPDVSLFASNGANLSAYPICAYAGECAAGSGGSAEVLLTGGTSASAPAMAGIMALVNQKYGRQGQANFTLYALAQQKPAAFHDIAVGSNSEICGGVSAPPNCILQWNGIYGTPQYPAGPGYDQASGLGSVDANVLVNQVECSRVPADADVAAAFEQQGDAWHAGRGDGIGDAGQRLRNAHGRRGDSDQLHAAGQPVADVFAADGRVWKRQHQLPARRRVPVNGALRRRWRLRDEHIVASFGNDYAGALQDQFFADEWKPGDCDGRLGAIQHSLPTERTTQRNERRTQQAGRNCDRDRDLHGGLDHGDGSVECRGHCGVGTARIGPRSAYGERDVLG